MSDIKILPEVSAFLARDHAHFIHGQPHTSRSNELIDVVDPSTAEVIAKVRVADDADIEAAMRSARQAFEHEWADTPPLRRGEILLKLADLIEQHREELAQIESLCSGKMIQLSRLFEVDQACVFLRFYAGWAGKINGETFSPSIPSFQGEHYMAYSRREPIGVVTGIVPWNFSIMIAIWKLASALICGCTIVIKPSEFTPLTMLRLAELATEAGVPAGVINIVNGRGATGQKLIEHPLTAKVSFTGSVSTGIAVGKSAVGANLTRMTLELGGKNGAAFLPDYDVDKTVAGILEAGYMHQGQICAAAERFYLHRSRIDEVLEKLSQQLATLKIGSPLDEATQFGPLSNKPHFDKVMSYFAKARSEQCQIVYGGEAVEGKGYYVQPTVIRANKPTDTLMVEETFGPVGTFLAYDSEDELLELMNSTPYGLSASIWTNDLSTAMRLTPRIEAGIVWVNMHTFLDPAVPFGGVKSSGLGREFGGAFIDDYTELKSVMIRY